MHKNNWIWRQLPISSVSKINFIGSLSYSVSNLKIHQYIICSSVIGISTILLSSGFSFHFCPVFIYLLHHISWITTTDLLQWLSLQYVKDNKLFFTHRDDSILNIEIKSKHLLHVLQELEIFCVLCFKLNHQRLLKPALALSESWTFC